VILPPAVHPPKRAAALIAAGLLALAAPLLYESATSLLIAEIVLQGSFTVLLAFFTWAIVGAARQMRLELEAEARVDDLTGLGNRRAFEQALNLELAHRARPGMGSRPSTTAWVTWLAIHALERSPTRCGARFAFRTRVRSCRPDRTPETWWRRRTRRSWVRSGCSWAEVAGAVPDYTF
jgi:hypothetical protein